MTDTPIILVTEAASFDLGLWIGLGAMSGVGGAIFAYALAEGALKAIVQWRGSK